jgi:hypothetical protein
MFNRLLMNMAAFPLFKAPAAGKVTYSGRKMLAMGVLEKE